MNKSLKKCFLIIFLLLGTFLFAACNKDGDSETKDGSLQKVLDAKKLILGLDENFPPMGFRDKNGELVGFDIDLAKEVTKRLGIELVLQPINWDLKDKELNIGNIDCIWNGMTITDQRKEEMKLSDPYMINEMVFVVNKNSGIKSDRDLKGKKVGTQGGSSTVEVLGGLDIAKDIEISYKDDNIALFDSLEKGEIDAVFIDSIFAYYFISEYNKEFYVLASSYSTEGFAIGFRKDDIALCEKIWETLMEMRKDGTLQKISVEWFDADITTVK